MDEGCGTIENLINDRSLNEENFNLIYFIIFLFNFNDFCRYRMVLY